PRARWEKLGYSGWTTLSGKNTLRPSSPSAHIRTLLNCRNRRTDLAPRYRPWKHGRGNEGFSYAMAGASVGTIRNMSGGALRTQPRQRNSATASVASKRAAPRGNEAAQVTASAGTQGVLARRRRSGRIGAGSGDARAIVRRLT